MTPERAKRFLKKLAGKMVWRHLRPTDPMSRWELLKILLQNLRPPLKQEPPSLRPTPPATFPEKERREHPKKLPRRRRLSVVDSITMILSLTSRELPKAGLDRRQEGPAGGDTIC